ncbi:glyoxalase superfamily protein [Sporosarcina luteola]|uniref:glyoxalase superfamily protein n=1 Tax=Sporosarcina luteola TaxID=582850 RepID=UPI00203B6F36|nr:glyoxalase superfamily protein [Sporosarcina luteola]MCM3709601.1 VOC family protein [Sporosarcina luteola]
MITPIFRIFDIGKALAFYVDYLGFQMDWQHQFAENMPFYFQISKNKTVLHLSEHHGDASPGSAIRIKMEDVRGYHAYLSEKDYCFANPGIENTPWGTLELRLIDPFSNRIIFYEECE